jgi:pimeloyl-ACP methyl ester carboxylesterase
MNPTPPNKTYDDQVVPFAAADGRALNLIHVRSSKPATRGPVLLVHGAGVRANLFRAPVPTNFVDALLEHGYDVWLENWRSSIDLSPSEWTLDQAALYDHPAAARKVCEMTGCDRIKAVIHCQGSTSFAMSAVAGLVPQVTTIVTNAVSLHPVVPSWSRFKLNFAVPTVRMMTRYIDPHWGVRAPTLTAKLLTGLVRLSHHECGNTVCKMVSFTYGSGFPALWRHEQLDDATHQWLKEEFGPVPLSFFRQMARCVNAGRMMRYENLQGLPADYTSAEPQTDARWSFFAGELSGCFLPPSQERSQAFIKQYRPGKSSLYRVPDYSHLDVFIGKNAARDVFPLMLAELDKGAGP